jgi:hypothetical protein
MERMGAGLRPLADAPVLASVDPAFELVDPAERIDASLVNAHVYGSFMLFFAGGTSVIRSGPASFPGTPPGGPGTCVDGLWYNSRGKPTAGSLEHPHPHCVGEGEGMSVVLEPISAWTYDPYRGCSFGTVCEFVYFSDPKVNDLEVEHLHGIKGGLGGTEGAGVVVAYAIDASTLGTTNLRVGTITFDLNQYDAPGEKLFGDCVIDAEARYLCLPRVIDATYEPLDRGGVGVTRVVTGFLWWAFAKEPYNY